MSASVSHFGGTAGTVSAGSAERRAAPAGATDHVTVWRHSAVRPPHVTRAANRPASISSATTRTETVGPTSASAAPPVTVSSTASPRTWSPPSSTSIRTRGTSTAPVIVTATRRGARPGASAAARARVAARAAKYTRPSSVLTANIVGVSGSSHNRVMFRDPHPPTHESTQKLAHVWLRISESIARKKKLGLINFSRRPGRHRVRRRCRASRQPRP